jgi:acyl-CoA thioesterase I
MFRLRLSPLAVLAACLLASSCSTGGCGFIFEGGNPATQGGNPAGSAAAAADPTAPVVRPRIVALGDSLTVGLGLLETESYPSLLQKKLDEEGYPLEIVNAGVSGDTSAGGLRRLDWALEGDVRILIVALGGNDGLRGLAIDDMKRNLTTIIERAREKNVVVILAGMEAPPNYGPEYVQSFRMAFRDVAGKQRVLLIPFLLDKVAGQGSLNQPDGIHPNAEGARVIADTVWPVVRSVLDQMGTAS